jgi:hypothetical protein
LHFYNAIQAARYIGVDPKTVRRWLKKGLLTAERTEQGWLAIPGGQVEYAKIKWEEEQAKFARPWLSKESLPAQPREDLDILGRVEELEWKVAELEEALSNASLGVPTQSVPVPATSAIPPKTKPQIRNVDANSLPDGCILASTFAKVHGMAPTTFTHHIEVGIAGEKVEVERRPKPGFTERKEKYLNPKQQEEAIAFWQRHNVKFTRTE